MNDAAVARPRMQSFARNTRGRDLVVGGIHGFFSRLQADLDRLGFDPEADRLFSVGDLVDRGPESGAVLQWLHQPWFHAVAGDHEHMACAYYHVCLDAVTYADNGGAWFICRAPDERAPYVEAFEQLPIVMEIETEGGVVGLVHANVPTATWADLLEALDGPDAAGSVADCTWSHSRDACGLQDTVPDVRAVVVGHTTVPQITARGNVLYIDTGAVFRGGNFTILDLATLQPVHIGQALDWRVPA